MPTSGHLPGPDRPVRLSTLDEADRSPRQQEVAAHLVQGPVVNIYTTLVRHPEAGAGSTGYDSQIQGMPYGTTPSGTIAGNGFFPIDDGTPYATSFGNQ